MVAGDITHDLKKLRDFFVEMKARFAYIFYVPGNHEMWIRPSDTAKDSLQKFKQILALCDELGILTKPKKVHLSCFSFLKEHTGRQCLDCASTVLVPSLVFSYETTQPHNSGLG